MSAKTAKLIAEQDVDDPAFADLVDRCCQFIETGRVDLAQQLIDSAPDHADALQRLLPAIEALTSIDEADAEAGKPARQLGDFRILGALGRGGMGPVYEAEQISMGRRVALKVLPFAALAGGHALQRFRNEVRAAAALDHPHIVSVYSVGEERGVHYYSMQLIRGQSLAQSIEQIRSELSTSSEGPSTEALTELSNRGSGNEDPTTGSASRASAITRREQQARITTAVESRRARAPTRTVARRGSQAPGALHQATQQ
ncbi:MAG: protein kinase, partial [Planctomycetota bacterium]